MHAQEMHKKLALVMSSPMQRADGALLEEAEEPEQGEVDWCQLPLDWAPQQEDQSQAFHTGTGTYLLLPNSIIHVRILVNGGQVKISVFMPIVLALGAIYTYSFEFELIDWKLWPCPPG